MKQGEKKKMEKEQEVYVEIETKEDEAKWKEFLRSYFPNHYAIPILDRNLVTESTDNYKVKVAHRIGVGKNGFGFLSAQCMIVGKRNGVYVEVKDFEEFKKTEVYKSIVEQGPKLEKGSLSIIDRNGNITREDDND